MDLYQTFTFHTFRLFLVIDMSKFISSLTGHMRLGNLKFQLSSIRGYNMDMDLGIYSNFHVHFFITYLCTSTLHFRHTEVPNGATEHSGGQRGRPTEVRITSIYFRFDFSLLILSKFTSSHIGHCTLKATTGLAESPGARGGSLRRLRPPTGNSPSLLP